MRPLVEPVMAAHCVLVGSSWLDVVAADVSISWCCSVTAGVLRDDGRPNERCLLLDLCEVASKEMADATGGVGCTW